jgi:D-glycero-alpha-D-manno-heptose-7-phosphate kinase
VIVASAPTRLDFGGGWTDVPPFPEERGGFVCNLAIERRATVQLELDADAPVPDDPLVAAALRYASLRGEGVMGARVRVHSDFPVAAGLGGSSALGVALQAAIAVARGSLPNAPLDSRINAQLEPQELAEASRAAEVEELGVAGGFQDHYAAAFGGALALTLTARRHAARIPLSSAAVAALEARVCVIYTGESRISGQTITAVLDAYRDRVPRVVQALDRMRDLAVGMAEALHAGNVSELSALVDEHWAHQQSLHPGITTPRIAAIEQAVRSAGAQGFKALGASGGGCVVAMGPAGAMPAIRAAAVALGDVLEWRVAQSGVLVSRQQPDGPAVHQPQDA